MRTVSLLKPFMLILLVALSACATDGAVTPGYDVGGGGVQSDKATGNTCGASGAPAWSCASLSSGGGCYAGGYEQVVSNDHKTRTVTAKVLVEQRPVAVGSNYPKTESHTLKPGESKVIGCSRGDVGGRFLFFFNITSAKYEN